MLKVSAANGKEAYLDIPDTDVQKAFTVASAATTMLLECGLLADGACLDGPRLLLALSDFARYVNHLEEKLKLFEASATLNQI